jgi:PKD repeat protein
MRKQTATILLLIACLALATLPAAGQEDGLQVTVAPVVGCGDVTFVAVVSGGSGTYDLTWAFGDGETLVQPGSSDFPAQVNHTYPEAGSYGWSLTAADTADSSLTGMSDGELRLGPSVALTSDIFPPLLTLVDGQASLNLTAGVTGGSTPYSFEWDLTGASSSSSEGAAASATYTSGGQFSAHVTVTDACGLSASDSLTIVVVDPDDADQACHPMAQRIAEAVSSLAPAQATQTYTCADIFAMFQGGEGEPNLGFGRMWHAYQLALTMEELTWEEILDWHLGGTGWGLLQQLDRFAETLADVGLKELVSMVLSGEHSVNDIRTAVRMVTRWDADFEDALSRLSEGASPGELQQLYRAASELGVDPAELDAYLEAGATLPEIRHAARTAARWGADWQSVLEAHSAGNSWGEIQQAFRLAGEDGDASAILEMGIQEFRRQQREAQQAEREADREAKRADREEQRAEREADREAKRAEREAERGDREAQRAEKAAQRAAARLAAQYGVTEAEVMSVYEGTCAGDWGCVRGYFRELRPGRPEGRGPRH